MLIDLGTDYTVPDSGTGAKPSFGFTGKSLVLLVCLLSLASAAGATLRYVNVNNPTPTSPYESWSTAATNIQDAVDAALAGDEIVVTNGVYDVGTRDVYGMSNRVAVTTPVTVRSVNGPGETRIMGYQVPVMTNGTAAVRCVYLTNGALVVGFTIANGATQTSGDWHRNRSGGGIWCEGMDAVVSNCVVTGNSANDGGGGAYGGTLINCLLTGNSAYDGGSAWLCNLTNCTLTGNSAVYGGGAFQATLNGCTLSTNSAQNAGGAVGWSTLTSCLLLSNSARDGGGTYWGTLNDCTLAGNFALWGGGGAYDGTLNNCLIISNSAGGGGGASLGIHTNGTLTNCTLVGNLALQAGGGVLKGGAYSVKVNNCVLRDNSADSGGGAYKCDLNNCTLAGNSSIHDGGGAYIARLYNCTLTGNLAGGRGGGTYISTMSNCIAVYNTALEGGNYYNGSIYYSCTTPLRSGPGNLTNEPLFMNTNGWSNLRLQSNSPCINAGDNSYLGSSYLTNFFDVDGKPRVVGGTVDLGAYEHQTPASVVSYAWLYQYGFPSDGSADYVDNDFDGMNNWQEWRCGTDPTNAWSVLRLVSATATATNVAVTWQSVVGVHYFLERSTNLAAAFTPLAARVQSQGGLTSYIDTNAASLAPLFYRVGVGN